MSSVRAPVAAPGLELAGARYSKLSPGPGKNAIEVAESQRARIHSAMIEIVAEQGYGSVTVRDLARLARISSRAFYQHFSGKEECFLQTHELVVRRAAMRTITSQAGERDWQERFRLAFRAFTRELMQDPKAARLILVEVHAVGPQAREQALWAEGIFAAMIKESFDRALEPTLLSPLITRGFAAGIASVVRSQALWNYECDPDILGDELVQWTLCCQDQVGQLSRPFSDQSTAGLRTALREQKDEMRSPAGNHDLILLATAKLAADDGNGSLTPSGVCAATGISRKTFDSHFDGIDDCVMATAESLAEQAFACAGLAKSSASSWDEGVHRAMAMLCECVARDPALARLCFIEVPALGQAGLHCRERFVAEIGDLICYGSPHGQSPDDVATEASAGAIWGLISQSVLSERRRQQLPHLVPTLASLALAPSRQRFRVMEPG